MSVNATLGEALSQNNKPIHACYPRLWCPWVINTLQTTHISLKEEDYRKVAAVQSCLCNNKQLSYPAAQRGPDNRSLKLHFVSVSHFPQNSVNPFMQNVEVDFVSRGR